MANNSHTDQHHQEPHRLPQTLKNPNKKYKKTEPSETQTPAPDNNTPTELNPTQSKYKPVPHPRMTPAPSMKHHPAFDMLLDYASAGCPVDCRPDWSREHIMAAIAHGPHLSAKNPAAAASIRAELLEKVAQGYACIIKWDDIKDNPPPKLKISPIAAVPHKSRLFCTILDLSFKLRLHGQRMASVNDSTTPRSNHKAMEQLGKVLWQIVTTIAQADPEKGHILMAKWDIKDGFWRLTVSEDDAWHFCYVLPCLHPNDPIELAVSTCLQMGWTESPPIFSTASETARDVGQEALVRQQPLPPHQLETLCLPETITLTKPTNLSTDSLAKLLEVYVDDFMGLFQAPTREELLHFTRAVLHGIHTVFPPPGPDNDPQDEPISIKKLLQGDGVWTTRKELLGWLFDGVTQCMQLPNEKVTKIKTQLKAILCQKTVRFGDLEKLNGKLMHATIGIPTDAGSSLPSLLHWQENRPPITTATAKHG